MNRIHATYALRRLRDAMLLAFGAGDVVRAAAQERQFLDKFITRAKPDALEHMGQLADAALRHITRNANATMVFLVLSLRFHQLLRSHG